MPSTPRLDNANAFSIEHSRHSSTASEIPNTPVSPVAHVLSHSSAYGLPASYVAASAAASHVLTDQKAKATARLEGQSPAATTVPSPVFAEGSLLLINAFLDHLLHHFLDIAKSTSLTSLRPAVEHVLKGKLARQAVASAEEELEDLLGVDRDDQELELLRTAPEKQSAWDTDCVFRRVRAKVMVYMSLADMDDEDELDTAEDGDVGDDPGLVSWAASIFLTSVMEYIAEQCLSIAGQAAYERASSKSAADQPRETSSFNDDLVLVAEQDVERISLATSLGRVWRAWRKAIRIAKNRSSGFPQQSELRREPSQIIRASINSIAPNNEEKTKEENVISVIPGDNASLDSEFTAAAAVAAASTKPAKLQLNDDPPQLASITEIESPGEMHATQRVLDEYRESSYRPQSRRPLSLLLSSSPIHSYPTPEASPGQPPDLQELKRNARRRKYLSLPDPYRQNFPASELEALRIAGEADGPIWEVRHSRRLSKLPQTENRRNPTEPSPITGAISDSSPPVTPIEDDGEVDYRPDADALSSPSPMDEQDEKTHISSPLDNAIAQHAYHQAIETSEYVEDISEKTRGTEDPRSRASTIASNDFDIPIPEPSQVMGGNSIYRAHNIPGEEYPDPEKEAWVIGSVMEKEPDLLETERNGLADVDDDGDDEEEIVEEQRISNERYYDFDDAVTTPQVVMSQQKTAGVLTDVAAVPAISATVPAAVHSLIKPDEHLSTEFGSAKNNGNNRLEDRHIPSLAAVPEYSIQESSGMTQSIEHSTRTSSDEPLGHARQYTIGQMVDMLSEPGNGVAMPGPVSARIPLDAVSEQRIGSISATRAPKEPSPKRSVESTPSSIKSRSKRQQGSHASSISESSSTRKGGIREINTGTVSPIIDDRASVKRVSGDSPRLSSSRHNESPFITRKVSRQSSETFESGNNARRSETLEKEFADLLAGEETVKYTLTPRNLTEIEQPDSPRYRANFEISTPLDEYMSDPVAAPGATVDRPATTADPNHEPATATDQPRAYIPISRPSIPRSGSTRKSGLVARDARAQNESIRDFADFIRSTAPDKQPDHNQPSIANTVPLAAANSSAAAVGQAKAMDSNMEIKTSQPVLGSAYDGISSASSPTVVRPVSSKSKSSLQPREAIARGRGYNADMIEFLRQGPSDGPAKVARLNDFSADSATLSSNKNASSVYSGSAQDSLHSRTALLSSPLPNSGFTTTQGSSSGPSRTQRRIKDPYQIDFSDDEEEEFHATRIRRPQAQEESMLDFLMNVPPPARSAPDASDLQAKRPATSGAPASRSCNMSRPGSQGLGNAKSMFSSYLEDSGSLDLALGGQSRGAAAAAAASAAAGAPSPEVLRNSKKPAAKRSFWRKITS